MPKVSSGKVGDRGTKERGKLEVTYQSISDELSPPRDDWPAALKVLFKVSGQDRMVTKFVPLDKTVSKRLEGFCPPTEATSEMGIRSHVEKTIIKEPIWIRLWGSIQERLAPVGTYRFKLHKLGPKRPNREGVNQTWFTMKTKEGLYTSTPIKYPDLQHTVGKTPEDDWIGPKDELAPAKYMFKYLISFGLDWTRFAEENNPECELLTCQALWPGHYTADGPPIEPFFSNPDDITQELVQAVARHGPRYVEIEIEDHPQYGLSPKRGDYSLITMTPVIVEGQDDTEFQKERARFLMSWGHLANVVLAKENVEVARGSTWTPDGRAVAMMAIVPIITAYPHVVTTQKEDGTPRITVPTSDTWDLDRMVCMSFVAEQLLEAHAKGEINLTDPIVGIINSKDSSALLEWVAENVPELESGEEDVL